MSKAQKHGNKETRKPKSDKAAVAPAAAPTFLDKAGTTAIGMPKKKP